MIIKINKNIYIDAFRNSDKAAIIEYLNDIEIYRNTLYIPYPYSDADADNYLEMIENEKKLPRFQAHWAIRSVKTKALLGSIGILYDYGDDSHNTSIGYWLARHLRKQNIMTEVVCVFSNYLLSNKLFSRVEAIVYLHNPASMRVLQKAGFEEEGILKKFIKKKDVFYDVVLFAKTI